MEYLIQLLMAYLGALGFGALYNLHGRKLQFAALGGLLGWAVYLGVGIFTDSPYPCAFVASSALTLYSELMARVHKTPTTIFLVTSAIPLIPGAGLYRTVSALMLRHTAEATVQGTYTLLFAASMASGITLTTLFFRLIMGHFCSVHRQA
jgi:uncharacterized membrane protein YjjB (DUF3815 family)